MNSGDGGIMLLVVIILILAFIGIASLSVVGTSTILDDKWWGCTEATLKDGKAMCMKYERKSQ